MDKIELATLAGFFAGEGSITLSGGEWPTMYAAIGNSEKFWIDKFVNGFKGSDYVEKPKYAGAKNIFRWRVSGKKALHFLQAIQPYLVGEKAAQAKLAIEFQIFKEESVKAPFKTSEAVRLMMGKFIESMKQLRRTAAETNRKDAAPLRNDSPILSES